MVTRNNKTYMLENTVLVLNLIRKQLISVYCTNLMQMFYVYSHHLHFMMGFESELQSCCTVSRVFSGSAASKVDDTQELTKGVENCVFSLEINIERAEI